MCFKWTSANYLLFILSFFLSNINPQMQILLRGWKKFRRPTLNSNLSLISFSQSYSPFRFVLNIYVFCFQEVHGACILLSEEVFYVCTSGTRRCSMCPASKPLVAGRDWTGLKFGGKRKPRDVANGKPQISTNEAVGGFWRMMTLGLEKTRIDCSFIKTQSGCWQRMRWTNALTRSVATPSGKFDCIPFKSSSTAGGCEQRAKYAVN